METRNFFSWYYKLTGFDLSRRNSLIKEVEQRDFIPLTVSSFKNRSEEVKQDYNYKFQER